MVGNAIMATTVTPLAPNLTSKYRPTAIYFANADIVEYVKRDGPCVYRRIDRFLTLALDLKTRKLVGFRVKGFKKFFLNHLRPKYKFLDDDFVPLVSVIEQVLLIVGHEVTRDPERRAAYRQAKKMAHEDSVAIPLLAA
jgi:hypothetical protein